jgi:L-ascorbate metabolism protein UlaG (beta-lactamase superfamily)
MVLIMVLLVVLAAFITAGYLLSGPVYRGPVTDHFDGKKFFTPGGKPANGLVDVLKWMLRRKQGPWKTVTTAKVGNKPAIRVEGGYCITFVNHSTFLIQADGLNLLTDPVWSERTSPFQWAGPKRMRPPGIRLEDLPPIDVVLLSHNHYDHLDMDTLRHLHAQHHPRFITALGVKAFLDQNGFTKTHDLDWWQSLSLGSLVIEAVPAQHFSGRGLFDRDATLWCGYVIRRRNGNIYFAGDTGYHPDFFREIGTRCAPIDAALLPIGAYKPEWFMSPIHCTPDEAVMIHRESKARKSIATHFGTFPLADDGQQEPAARLLQALQTQQLSETDFIILPEGEAFRG